MMKRLDVLQMGYEQRMYRDAAAGMLLLVSFYTILLAGMVLIFGGLVKEIGIMAQDMILLSVLNFVGSMITNVVVELYVVEMDIAAFVLFDEKLDLLWKVLMIAVFIFAGEAALIYFWRRYRILFSERQNKSKRGYFLCNSHAAAE